MLSFLWTIIIGFIAGVIAKFITPGEKEPQGFIFTTALGIKASGLRDVTGFAGLRWQAFPALQPAARSVGVTDPALE